MTRRRIDRRGDDDGIGIPFVMLISIMVMIMLGTATAALVAQIKPAAGTVAGGQAMAAAEAGIDDAAGWLNTNCGSPDGLSCATAPTVGQEVTKTLGANQRESFTWRVIAFVPGKLRVSSTGRSLGPSVGGVPQVLKSATLVGDITATPSFTNFQYYTKYETFPSDFVNSFYAPRSVQITSAAAAAGSSLSGPGTLNWQGTCVSTDSNDLSHCTPPNGSAQANSANICEDLYFPSPSGGLGRSTDAAWNNAARRPSPATQSAMGLSGPNSNYFAYYSENGTFAPTTGPPVPETHNDTCDSTFEPNMVMNGPIYSQDAYLIDRGEDTGNSANSMPIFGDSALSMWDGTTNGVRQAVGPNGGYARAYPGTDGQISTTLSPQPVYTTDELELPANGDIAKGLATCTYTGPTRIVLKQGIASITSPMTPTAPMPIGPRYCYTSTGNFANTNAAAGTGVANAQVPVNNTIIYVTNPTASEHPVATASSPIFSLSSNTFLPPTTATTSFSGSATSPAYSTTTKCPTVFGNTFTQLQFDCEVSGTPANQLPPDVLGAANGVKAALTDAAGAAATVPAGTVRTDLTSRLANNFLGANVASVAPTSLAKNAVQYVASIGARAAVGSSTTTPAPSQTDTFYRTTAGSYATQSYQWPVTITRYSCSKTSGCGATCTDSNNCPSIDSSAVFTGTLSRIENTANGQVNTTSTWPWFGAQPGPNTYTDMNNDITPYQSNWGDVYIQGQLTGEMTVVAEHDIVATNDITYTNPHPATTSDGLALVADHNARIYRPMACTDDGTAGSTTAGYCPNDLTGVYNTTLSWPLPANYPALKYKADGAPSMTGTGSGSGTGQFFATVFTLRGSFMIDNFYRGNVGADLSVTGGLYQYHRGPTSLPYQNRPYQGSGTKMPGVTLTYTYDNMRQAQNLLGGLRVPWVPNPQNRPSTSTRTWNTVAISTGS